MLIVSAHFATSSVAFAGASELSQVMDEEVCAALEAAEEARALLPALLSAFDNHQVCVNFDEMVKLITMRKKMKLEMVITKFSALDNHQVCNSDDAVEIVRTIPFSFLPRRTASTSCWTSPPATRRTAQSG